MRILSPDLKKLKKYFDDLPKESATAMRMSMNQVMERSGLKVIREDIYSQIAYPRGYIDKSRLGITKKASDKDLSLIVTAQDRPTSLARFASQRNVKANRGKPVTLTVTPGNTHDHKKAFLINLRSGNIGLAVRLKDGERMNNSRGAKRLAPNSNAFLLYGPSVEQTMISVAEERSDYLSDLISLEFVRQIERIK